MIGSGLELLFAAGSFDAVIDCGVLYSVREWAFGEGKVANITHLDLPEHRNEAFAPRPSF